MSGEQIIAPLRTRAAFGPITNNQGTPYQFILTGTERLRILCITDDGTATFTVNGRMQQADGTITPFSLVGQSTFSANLQTTDFNIGAGTLLTLTIAVVSQTGTQMWGRNWVQAQIVEGTGAAAVVLGTLVQSYFTAKLPVAWPSTPFRAAVEGPGLTTVTSIFGSIPGTTAFRYGPGATFRQKLIGLSYNYSADAVAGNRIVQVYLEALNAVPAWVVASPAIAPSTNRSIFMVPGAASADYGATLGIYVLGLPEDVILCATDKLLIQTAGADAGDTMTSGNVSAQTWYDL